MHRIAILLALVFGRAGTLDAQAEPVRTSDRYAAMSALGIKPGHTVRLAVPGEGRVAGDVKSFGPTDGITVLTARGERAFPTLPDTLWTRRRAIVPGAIIGGVLGAGAGVLFGLVVDAMCESSCGSAVGEATVGALLVGVGGAAVGALVGAGIPRWHRSVP